VPIRLPRRGGRFLFPGVFLLFGNGIAAAAIYGKTLRPRSTGTAWLETLIGEVAAILLVSLIPKRSFFVRVRGRTMNVAFAVALLGGYVVAASAGAFAAVGFTFGGIAAVAYWTAQPRTIRHLVARLQREGVIEKP
jgi:hypothetical protein